MIAEIEQFVEVESFFTDGVFFHVDLESLALLLDMRESGLAHKADGHDASGDADVDAIGFELLAGFLAVVGENLRDGVRGFVMIRIGLLAERFDLAQLVFAKVIYVFVECHFAQGRPEGRVMMSAIGDYSEENIADAEMQRCFAPLNVPSSRGVSDFLCLRFAECILIELEIAFNHAVDGEILFNILPDIGWIQIQIGHTFNHLLHVAADVAGDAIAHNLRHGATRSGKHRSTAGHGFHHH